MILHSIMGQCCLWHLTKIRKIIFCMLFHINNEKKGNKNGSQILIQIMTNGCILNKNLTAIFIALFSLFM